MKSGSLVGPALGKGSPKLDFPFCFLGIILKSEVKQMWFTYIIYSKKINKYYIGFTNNLQWRLERHNLGWGRFTKSGTPWELVYFEEFETKKEAMAREKEIKQQKSRKYIEMLVDEFNCRRSSR